MSERLERLDCLKHNPGAVGGGNAAISCIQTDVKREEEARFRFSSLDFQHTEVRFLVLLFCS